MEISAEHSSPRLRLDHLRREGLGFELEPYDRSGREARPMSALEILRESVRILRHNSSAFMAITALLICPVSAIVLSGFLVDRSLVRRLTTTLVMVAQSSGLPLWPIVEQSCRRFAGSAVSAMMSFPIHASVSLLAKAAIVCAVDCSYAGKQFDSSKFFAILPKIWRLILSTYVWAAMAVAGVVTLSFLTLAAVCNVLSAIGAPPSAVAYAAAGVAGVCSVVLADAVVVCGVAVAIAVAEESPGGAEVVVRAGGLIRGRCRVGVVMLVWWAVAEAFLEGLFEHRVRTVSYGDGLSRLWEGPLLVLMDAFVALVYAMMIAVFYYSCRSAAAEGSESECRPILVDSVVADEFA